MGAYTEEDVEASNPAVGERLLPDDTLRRYRSSRALLASLALFTAMTKLLISVKTLRTVSITA